MAVVIREDLLIESTRVHLGVDVDIIVKKGLL